MPNFTFLNPYYLLLTSINSLGFLVEGLDPKGYIFFKNLNGFQNTLSGWDNSILWIVTIYTLLVLVLPLPFTYEAKELSTKKGRDLILTIDVVVQWSKGFSREESGKSRLR